MLEFYEKLQELIVGNVPFVSITIVDTIGSVPQNAGSKMLVTSDGLYFGTVGGGRVEKRAIEEAQSFLAGSNSASRSAKPASLDNTAGASPASKKSSSENTNDVLLAGTSGVQPASTPALIRTGDATTRFVNWSLDKDIGMTCGGSVKLYFEVFNTNLWNIAVFGAGHCSQALIGLLINLDCRVTCYDTRSEWLDRLPGSPKLKKVQSDSLPGMVSQLVPDSFVILMTMGHTTDKPILLELLRHWKTTSYPYLGIIGSKAKAARLYKDIEDARLPADYKSLFHCPMGLPIGNNHPQEIAISIVAQLLHERDKLNA